MAYLIGKVLGKYEIVRKIGRGGMASVFQAIDVTNDRIVAIKVISPGLAEEEGFMARFRREAKVLTGLRHPNIVPILDFGEQDGLAYIVMPYMKVGTLRERLIESPLSPEEGANIVNQVASALQYAHDTGVVHRDVKPSNVLIDEKGNAWLSDFGTAQVHDATMTLTGSGLIGTPTYMAPEQARGEKVSPLADEYALGVILFQICTGRLPYEADTPLAIALMHAHDPLPLPRLVNENLPPAIEAVLVKALAKDPEDRYPSVMEMNQAFQKSLQDVYDPESGKLKPGAKAPPPSVDDFVVLTDDDSEDVEEDRLRRRRVPVLLLILSPLLLGLIWGGARLVREATGGVPPGAAASDGSPTPNHQATIDSLSTAVALGVGTNLSIEQIEAAVSATLGAMNATLAHAGEDTLTPAPTWTPESETATPSPPAVLSPTITPTRTRTPTKTVTRTQTRTSTPSTPPSPTTTLTVTLSPTVTLTATVPPPPTATPSRTPTPNPCDGVSLGSFSTPSNIAQWRIGNSSGSTITLTQLTLDWPSSNDALFNVALGGSFIWADEDLSPPTPISSWIGGSGDRQIVSSATLEFHFGNMAQGSGYDLQVTFNNGCTLSDSR